MWTEPVLGFLTTRWTRSSWHQFKLLLLALLLVSAAASPVEAQPQIGVHPTGVNVNASGPTTVFLTFGGLDGYVPAEATWCGDLIDAFPDFGNRCNPATIFGRLPLRHDFARFSGDDGFTDIMTIPASVARRAYQDATHGADSRFFYVRRFVDPFDAAVPQVFVAVTCRLAGGGARVPFALLDVQMAFGAATGEEIPLLSVEQGRTLPPLSAEISYNGTGLLRGRWEVVRPGEEPPSTRDLLTEATLPVEERGLQRRYSELSRFSVFLPPSTGTRFVLPGPDPARLPADVDGLYQILLRIEATNDKEGDSNLASVGAGSGVVHSGAVAGFPIPPLRYFVGGADTSPAALVAAKLYLLFPEADATLAQNAALDFSWTEVPQALRYRLEVEDGQENRLLKALLPAAVTAYRAPPWLREQTTDGALRWRVAAINLAGREIGYTPWRSLRLGDANAQ